MKGYFNVKKINNYSYDVTTLKEFSCMNKKDAEETFYQWLYDVLKDEKEYWTSRFQIPKETDFQTITKRAVENNIFLTFGFVDENEKIFAIRRVNESQDEEEETILTLQYISFDCEKSSELFNLDEEPKEIDLLFQSLQEKLER